MSFEDQMCQEAKGQKMKTTYVSVVRVMVTVLAVVSFHGVQVATECKRLLHVTYH